MRFLAQIIINALAIFLAAYLVPGIIFEGSFFNLLIAGLVLGLVNFFIKPILKLVSRPLIFLSFGLFTIVINIILLFLVAYLLPELLISNFWAALWGVLIISLVNIFFSVFTKKKRKELKE